MSKYTPGPWEYDGQMFIFAGDGSGPVAEVRGFGAGKPMNDNGRLLAAAPELLEALLAAERNQGGDSEYCPVCGEHQALLMGGWEDHAPDCILVSAIEKAEGRS